MAFQRVQEFSCLAVKDADGPILAPAGHFEPIRTESNTQHKLFSLGLLLCLHGVPSALSSHWAAEESREMF